MEPLSSITDRETLIKIANANYHTLGAKINHALETDHWDYIANIINELEDAAEIQIEYVRDQHARYYSYVITSFAVKNQEKFSEVVSYHGLALDKENTKSEVVEYLTDLLNNVPVYHELDEDDINMFIEIFISDETDFSVDENHKLYYKNEPYEF